MMKHWKWTAMETIAWLRICRPGSIIGHQQEWMIEKELEMWKQGDYFRKINKNVSKYPNMLTNTCRFPVYSLHLKKKLLERQNNQRVQNSPVDNIQEDNENGNNHIAVPSKRPSGGGDAYTKMVTKVERIKIEDENNGNILSSPLPSMQSPTIENEGNSNIVEERIVQDGEHINVNEGALEDQFDNHNFDNASNQDDNLNSNYSNSRNSNKSLRNQKDKSMRQETKRNTSLGEKATNENEIVNNRGVNPEVVLDPDNKGVMTQGDRLNAIKARKQTQSLQGGTKLGNLRNVVSSDQGHSRVKSVPAPVPLSTASGSGRGSSSATSSGKLQPLNSRGADFISDKKPIFTMTIQLLFT